MGEPALARAAAAPTHPCAAYPWVTGCPAWQWLAVRLPSPSTNPPLAPAPLPPGQLQLATAATIAAEGGGGQVNQAELRTKMAAVQKVGLNQAAELAPLSWLCHPLQT